MQLSFRCFTMLHASLEEWLASIAAVGLDWQVVWASVPAHVVPHGSVFCPLLKASSSFIIILQNTSFPQHKPQKGQIPAFLLTWQWGSTDVLENFGVFLSCLPQQSKLWKHGTTFYHPLCCMLKTICLYLYWLLLILNWAKLSLPLTRQPIFKDQISFVVLLSANF